MGTLRKGTGDPIVKPGSSKPRKPAGPKRKSAAPKTSPRPKARPTYARSTPPRDYFTKAEPKGPLKKKKSTPSKADDRPSSKPSKPNKSYKKGSSSPRGKGPMRFSAKAGASVPPNRMAKK